jgi:hypothetical protein
MVKLILIGVIVYYAGRKMKKKKLPTKYKRKVWEINPVTRKKPKRRKLRSRDKKRLEEEIDGT